MVFIIIWSVVYWNIECLLIWLNIKWLYVCSGIGGGYYDYFYEFLNMRLDIESDVENVFSVIFKYK